jgi:6-bladed beta-propeller protein
MLILLAIVQLAPLAPRGAPDTVRARLTATIGENAPRTPFLLGEISGLALDDSGRVYVADFQEPRIVVFAGDGRLLATIGRKGRGPGEFTAPTGPVIGPDGALYVRNMGQVARFVRDPKTGLLSVFDRSFAGPAMAPWRSKVSSVIDRTGRFHFPQEVGLADGLTHFAYRRYSLAGVRLDSIGVPIYPTTRSGWAFIRTSEHGGRMVAGFNVVPFHPNPVWTVSAAGTILSGPADRYELSETDSAGRVLRKLTRAEAATPIPPAERAESLRALKRRIDSLPLPVSQLEGASEEVKAQRLPANYPFYRGVIVTPGGAIWVRRWTTAAQRGTSVLDVFDAQGEYQRTVVLPMDCANLPALVVRGNTVACVQLDPESGAESVLLARLDR